MQDHQLYARILGLTAPWQVTDVALDDARSLIEVRVAHSGKGFLPCPTCQQASPGYDRRPRRWRHLDTCQYQTILVCDVPRIECPEHGVLQVQVPWADEGSRFTALFEGLVIAWMREASLAAVSRRLRLTWDQLDTIQRRAVARGLKRRGKVALRRIGVDETSFQRRHEYVTAVTDLKAPEPRVLHVADGRGQAALDGFYDLYSHEELETLEAVCMDMWAPYVRSTMEHVPGAEQKICYDRFHVAQHLAQAVDQVRRIESRLLQEQGDPQLKRTRYLWLRSPEKMAAGERRSLDELKDGCLKTARAWQLKEFARHLWSYVSRGWARRAWKAWLAWASRSRLQPVIKVARMIRTHLEGILNAIVLGATNAKAEALNAKIQWIKRKACGFRNRDRFRTAIYFHCGGLDLRPQVLVTHTKA